MTQWVRLLSKNTVWHNYEERRARSKEEVARASLAKRMETFVPLAPRKVAVTVLVMEEVAMALAVSLVVVDMVGMATVSVVTKPFWRWWRLMILTVTMISFQIWTSEGRKLWWSPALCHIFKPGWLWYFHQQQ